jgi:hypothetical protein
MRTTAILTTWLFVGILMLVAASNPAGAASTSVTCKDGKTVKVTTGTDSGTCTVEADDLQNCMSAPGVCQYAGCSDGNKEGWGGCNGAGKAYCGLKGCTIQRVVGTPTPPAPGGNGKPLLPGLLDTRPGLAPIGPPPTGTPKAPTPPAGPVLR